MLCNAKSPVRPSAPSNTLKSRAVFSGQRTAASILRRLSLQLIGGLLGHATIRTTERYAHLVNTAQRDAVERIGDGLARALGAPPARE